MTVITPPTESEIPPAIIVDIVLGVCSFLFCVFVVFRCLKRRQKSSKLLFLQQEQEQSQRIRQYELEEKCSGSEQPPLPLPLPSSSPSSPSSPSSVSLSLLQPSPKPESSSTLFSFPFSSHSPLTNAPHSVLAPVVNAPHTNSTSNTSLFRSQNTVQERALPYPVPRVVKIEITDRRYPAGPQTGDATRELRHPHSRMSLFKNKEMEEEQRQQKGKGKGKSKEEEERQEKEKEKIRMIEWNARSQLVESLSRAQIYHDWSREEKTEESEEDLSRAGSVLSSVYSHTPTTAGFNIQ